MDSYGDKFLSSPNNIDCKKDYQTKDSYTKSTGQSNPFDRNTDSNYNSIGSYDPYNSNKPLSEKIGVILGDVDKIKEGDNAEVIKAKETQGGNKK